MYHGFWRRISQHRRCSVLILGFLLDNVIVVVVVMNFGSSLSAQIVVRSKKRNLAVPLEAPEKLPAGETFGPLAVRLLERRVGSSQSEGRALVRIIIASQTTRGPSYSI